MKLEGKRTYTERDYLYQNNLDFLAAVIGHEYYHAWQFHNEQDIFPLYHAKLKSYFEVGAEIYETTALNKWKDHLQELGVYKAVATGG